MPLAGEPDDDEAVDEHRHRGGPLDCFPAPALRLFKPEALLYVSIGNLNAPAG